MTSVIMPEPDLRMLRAANPSPMTGDGTNTYILGSDEVCVIDPGPDESAHLAALLEILGQVGRLRSILVTHSHLDHSPLARRLAQATGAEIVAFGDSHAGRSAQMTARAGLARGGEGVDTAFRPDRRLKDNETVVFGTEQVRAIWTPGHFGNHLCFAWRGAVFSGDHVMAWSTTLVSPPDGDIGAYMRSLDRLEAEAPRRLYPGHGDPVETPRQRIAELRAHRRARERAILAALASGQRRISALVAEIYADTPPELHAAAARNVFAHLIDLHDRGLVRTGPELRPDGVFSRV